MKSKSKNKLLLRIVVFTSGIVLLLAAIAMGLVYYIFYIPEPEGLSLASWPSTFTKNFSLWLYSENGDICVKEIGLERLDDYGLWVQIVDERGNEVFSHNKPNAYPQRYQPSELISFSTENYDDNYTIFVSSFEDQGNTWNYIVGFPYAIGKYMLYYNGENVGRLSPMIRAAIFIAFIALIVFVIAYCFWLSHKLSKISGGIKDISLRTYVPIKENGTFGEVYKALNKMDDEIKHADKIEQETEQTRRTWIANITHDMKTPLSPIKGYAELLSDGKLTDKAAIQESGAIILKNVNHTEKLINDLKLTYQLESGAFPYDPKAVLLVRSLREWVIDVINDPQFSENDIELDSSGPEITVHIDEALFRRAVQNIIINAFIHNPPKTKVTVDVSDEDGKTVTISIRDNGTGMNGEELSRLFSRYYRGTNTEQKAEGSGLGLAIARQIILLHGGDIAVTSTLGEGTEFVITLPVTN